MALQCCVAHAAISVTNRFCDAVLLPQQWVQAKKVRQSNLSKQWAREKGGVGSEDEGPDYGEGYDDGFDDQMEGMVGAGRCHSFDGCVHAMAGPGSFDGCVRAMAGLGRRKAVGPVDSAGGHRRKRLVQSIDCTWKKV